MWSFFWRFCCSSALCVQSFALKVTWETVAAAAVTDNAGNQLLRGEDREDELTLQTERRVTLCPPPSFGFPTWAPVND